MYPATVFKLLKVAVRLTAQIEARESNFNYLLFYDNNVVF